MAIASGFNSSSHFRSSTLFKDSFASFLYLAFLRGTPSHRPTVQPTFSFDLSSSGPREDQDALLHGREVPDAPAFADLQERDIDLRALAFEKCARPHRENRRHSMPCGSPKPEMQEAITCSQPLDVDAALSLSIGRVARAFGAEAFPLSDEGFERGMRRHQPPQGVRIAVIDKLVLCIVFRPARGGVQRESDDMSAGGIIFAGIAMHRMRARDVVVLAVRCRTLGIQLIVGRSQGDRGIVDRVAAGR